MDDSTFLAAFEAGSIPSERWAHRDHVRMAFLYLRAHPFELALTRMRSGIRALNRAHQRTDDLTSGYHETVTVAWARIIAAALEDGDWDGEFLCFAEANPQLLERSRLGTHYRREHLLTEEARAAFVEPDLEPLPSPGAPGQP